MPTTNKGICFCSLCKGRTQNQLSRALALLDRIQISKVLPAKGNRYLEVNKLIEFLLETYTSRGSRPTKVSKLSISSMIESFETLQKSEDGEAKKMNSTNVSSPLEKHQPASPPTELSSLIRCIPVLSPTSILGKRKRENYSRASPSSYSFTATPMEVNRKGTQSPYSHKHLVTFEMLPDSLPLYRDLELVWYKLRQVIHIPPGVLQDSQPLQIRYWPAIVLTRRKAEIEKPSLAFGIQLLGLRPREERVSVSDVIPWRGYDYNNLQARLEFDSRITEPEARSIYADYGVAMTNLAYAIKIGVCLNSIVSFRHAPVEPMIPGAEVYGALKQIWHGAEVWSVGDFVILKPRPKENNRPLVSNGGRENVRECSILLIENIEQIIRINPQPTNKGLYNFVGYRFKMLIGRPEIRKDGMTPQTASSLCQTPEAELAMLPYMLSSLHLGSTSKVTRSGYTFHLIMESVKKVVQTSNQIIGRMYSLNNLIDSVGQEESRDIRAPHLCGLEMDITELK